MDDKTVKDSKPKNFYSVNLTEGRIFIIFVAIILFIAVVFFGVFIFISQTSKNKAVQNETLTTTPSNNDYTYYSDLTSELTKSDAVAETSADKTLKVEIKKENKSKISKPDDLSVIEVDNSEVLYSSKAKEISKEKILKKQNEKSKITKKGETGTDKKAAVKKTEKTANTVKESNKKFVVQVGSFTNKTTALEIEAFYQKEKYPTYIKSIESSGKTFYRLRIGPFAEKVKAEKYLTDLKQSKYGKNSFISMVITK
jgi:cell division septation protein DedD